MIEKIPAYVVPDKELSKQEREDMELANWAFNSHYWIEDPAGYYTCKYCGRLHTSVSPIDRTFQLCRENPIIKNFIVQLKRGG